MNTKSKSMTALLNLVKAAVFAALIAVMTAYNKILNKTTAFMPLVSGLITIFGYLLAEGLLYSFPTALTSVPFSIIQAVGSAIIYYIAAPALDKVKFKTKLS